VTGLGGSVGQAGAECSGYRLPRSSAVDGGNVKNCAHAALRAKTDDWQSSEKAACRPDSGNVCAAGENGATNARFRAIPRCRRIYIFVELTWRFFLVCGFVPRE